MLYFPNITQSFLTVSQASLYSSSRNLDLILTSLDLACLRPKFRISPDLEVLGKQIQNYPKIPSKVFHILYFLPTFSIPECTWQAVELERINTCRKPEE
jgi:hypothetical protein